MATSLKAKAKRMIHAIHDMELALCGAEELIDIPNTWGEGDAKPADHVKFKINLTATQVWHIVNAHLELNEIMHDSEFKLNLFK
jgi:hypothetical protein